MSPAPNFLPLATDSAEQLAEITRLLTICELPTSDISSSNSILFFGLHSEGKLIGMIGLEIYGSVALLRSLAVAPEQRKHSLGISLVKFSEAYAAQQGIESMYLLTATAEKFFAKLGYSSASREDAPSSIKATSQFSGLCPSTSSFMCKSFH